MTPRVVLEHKDVATRGLSFHFATELISEPTDWCGFSDTRHLVYMYRGDAMHSMQTALDWGPTGQVPRVTRNIPAEYRGNRGVSGLLDAKPLRDGVQAARRNFAQRLPARYVTA